MLPEHQIVIYTRDELLNDLLVFMLTRLGYQCGVSRSASECTQLGAAALRTLLIFGPHIPASEIDLIMQGLQHVPGVEVMVLVRGGATPPVPGPATERPYAQHDLLFDVQALNDTVRLLLTSTPLTS